METRSKRRRREIDNLIAAGKALPEDKWLEAAEPHFMTIADFDHMKEGDKEEFILFDRNWQDVTFHNKEDTIYTPQKYFRNAYFVQYTHVYGIFGTRIWFADGERLPPLGERYWELEWNTNYHCWYPITGGILRLVQPDYERPFPPHVNNKHWADFPKTTLVGWRGPMMRRADLSKMPNITRRRDDSNSEDDILR